MKLFSIHTDLFKLDGGAMFGVVPKTLWEKQLSADNNNMCVLSMRLLLIDDGEKVILIDTGIGDKQTEKFFSRYYLHDHKDLKESLGEIGYRLEDITDVFLTHLHFDHVGGAIIRKDDQLVPLFPNAIYWSNELHWQWAVSPNDREKASFLEENILPLLQQNCLRFLPIIQQGSRIEFTKQIEVGFYNGHTKGMMLPFIKYKGETIVYVADLIPTSAHFPLPYLASYDVYPLDAMKEKQHFLEEALIKGYIIFFEHDAKVECCRIKKDEKGKIIVNENFLIRDI